MPLSDPGDDWDDDDSGLDALVLPASDDDEPSDLDALGGYPAVDARVDSSVLDNLEPRDDPGPSVHAVQVASPDGAITMTAYLNGSIARVDLSPVVTRWTERELAAALVELADVAAKRATAVVHVVVVEMLVAEGLDLTEAREFVGSNLPFATPAQADAAIEELSARYAQQAQ